MNFEEKIRNLFSEFIHPSQAVGMIPKWFWNRPLSQMTREYMKTFLLNLRDKDGYQGVMPVPEPKMEGYLGEEYLERFHECMDILQELGMYAILWDECGFPSGRADGRLEESYPEHTAKYLQMHEWDFTGPFHQTVTLPNSPIMSVVLMNTQTLERKDCTKLAANGKLSVSADSSAWKLMAFTLERNPVVGLHGGKGRFVDYLNRDAVRAYISVNQQVYYDAMPQHFGTTIRYEFYDESSFWYSEGGRLWTGSFNHEFEREYGFSPCSLYPALWYDIGDETAYARNLLFQLRAKLYAKNYIGTLAEWCEDHGLQLTGHQDQEEMVCPVPLSGDLMEAFHWQHIPGIDVCPHRGRVCRALRIVSSAARNYDKPLIMCEAFGGNDYFPPDYLYRDTMEMFAGGINMLIEYGVWCDTERMRRPPELSHQNPIMAPIIPEFHRYVSRLEKLLQGGRHVCDVAILYPIETLQAGYRFGPEIQYTGGQTAWEADYMEVGELLAYRLWTDHTFLHPQTLQERCTVKGGRLVLENQRNREEYRVLVVTGSQVISLRSLQKIAEFSRTGGSVIFTGTLPIQGISPAEDKAVCRLVQEMTGKSPLMPDVSYTVHTFGNGKVICLGVLCLKNLQHAVTEAQEIYDVVLQPWRIRNGPLQSSPFDWCSHLPCGSLSYLHRKNDDISILFLANSSDIPLSLHIALRGRHNHAQLWDPQKGTRETLTVFSYQKVPNGYVTDFEIQLPAVYSVFLLSTEEEIL